MGDWSSPIYCISQVFIVLSYMMLAWTYFIKSRAVLLVVVISSNTAMGIGFGFLTAWVAVGMCIVAIIRDIVQSTINRFRNRQDAGATAPTNPNRITKTDCGLLALWVTILVTITAFTQDGFWSWFALFATLTFTVSIWQKNKIVYNFMGIFVSAFWIIYNVFVESFFGVTLESLLLVAVIIGAVLSVVKLNNKVSTPQVTSQAQAQQ